ncbi:FKBP-like peptidyl-prolyl cis-trans isomerase family protein isoform X2 [Carex rostrata]
MTLAFSALAPYQVSLPPAPQCQTRNQTRIRSDIQTVSPVSLITTRRSLLHHSSTILLYFITGGDASAASAVKFFEIAGSGGVKALELRAGSGGTPRDGDEVIPGIEAAVKSMKVGGILRAVIPPSQGYQSTSQEPIPPNFFDRQRLFTTIFNPTRLANGEGSTLGTLVFDIELVSIRRP